MPAQAIGFIMVGVISGSVNVLTRMIFNIFTSYEVAVVIAFLVALTLAFVLNRCFVFKAVDGTTKTQYIKFAATNLFVLLQVWLISVGLVRFIFPYLDFHWHGETLAHVIGVASPMATSFFAYKYFVFAHDPALVRRQAEKSPSSGMKSGA